MNIRFLIAWLALGLLTAGGCARPYEITVHTDFVPSAEFSAFHTFAFSGMTDRGRKIETSDKSPLRMRMKEMVHEQLVAKGIQQVGVEDRPDLLVHLLFGVNETREFQEATLIVDLTESSKKELVWRAVIRAICGGRLGEEFSNGQQGSRQGIQRLSPAK